MKQLIFTVTNDLNYDRRMIRICGTLAETGYAVKLVGVKHASSLPPTQQNFAQKRLPVILKKGAGFYIEYNVRLFFYLLFTKADCLCAIDLDTILPIYIISLLKRKKRVYDAHELFCEMKEVVTRPKIYRVWKKIEKLTVPHFKAGYTVNSLIAREFKKMYGVNYDVIRNMPRTENIFPQHNTGNFILYQGAVNEARSFETLIPAMKYIDHQLVICGDGNFMAQAKQLAADDNLQDKVIFKGKLLPAALKLFTPTAKIGITIFENSGLSNYYSLANRFFDYLHAGIPQLCSDYPVYREINDEYDIALLIRDLSEESIALSIQKLFTDELLYKRLKQNCARAAKELCWQEEEKKLVNFYAKIFE